MALKTRLGRDSYINFTLFNIFPPVCSKWGTAYFRRNAKLKNNLRESFSSSNDNWARQAHGSRTNVTSTSKTSDFVDRSCFILTSAPFPTGTAIQSLRGAPEPRCMASPGAALRTVNFHTGLPLPATHLAPPSTSSRRSTHTWASFSRRTSLGSSISRCVRPIKMTPLSWHSPTPWAPTANDKPGTARSSALTREDGTFGLFVIIIIITVVVVVNAPSRGL